MSDNCNVDEVIKQMKNIENLKSLRDNPLVARYPGFGNQLDTIITEQEAELEKVMTECGKMETAEEPINIPEPMPELAPEPVIADTD